MFHISTDMQSRLVRIDSGNRVWNIETLDRFADALFKEAKRFHAIGLPFDILDDQTEFPVQTQEMTAGTQKVILGLKSLGLRKSAIFFRNPLGKMQLTRVVPDDSFRFFASEAEALAWLAE